MELPNRTIKVAYADDHDLVRKGICELVNAKGSCHISIEARNGKELIENLDSAVDLPDICMVDLFMPVMNGFDTMIAIRNRWPEMRILVLTGHNSDYFLIKTILAGANGYLLKDCHPDQLSLALKSIHDLGIYHSEIMSRHFFHAVLRKEIKLPSLNHIETEFLKHCCSDSSYLQIADILGVTLKSVDWYRECLFKKLNVASRSGLVMCAVRFGLVPIQSDITGTMINQGHE